MNTHGITHSIVLRVGACAMLLGLVVASPAHAQSDSCCFTNFRYAGACRETPPPGGTCADILNYLNNLQSVGQPYCGGTIIRGGWTLVSCSDGSRHGAGPVEPSPLKPLTPGNVQPQDAPSVVQPEHVGPPIGEVSSTDANLLQISGNTSDMLVLLQASSAWRDAFEHHDANALAGLFTTDGTLVLPDGRSVTGKTAIARTWKQVFADKDLTYTLKNLEASAQGDLAYKLGQYTVTNPDGSVKYEGLYMEIWTRRDGVWQLHRQIFTRTDTTEAPAKG